MSVWTVAPDTDTIELVYVKQNGTKEPERHAFWITVKRNLSIGEKRGIMTAGWGGFEQTSPGSGNGRMPVDWKTTTFARTLGYLVAWSLKNDDGSPMAINTATVGALNEDVYTLISEAIVSHVNKIDAEKKALAGAQSSSATPAT